MKNRALQVLIICLLMTGLMSCGGVSQSEFDTLKAENDKLKIEIEDLKFGPDKLLLQSKSYLESKDYQNAKKELQSLLDKHAGSKQAIEAKQLILVADIGIREEKLAQDKAKLEKEKAEKDRLANATKRCELSLTIWIT